jgi:hypothetical protein
MRRKAPTRSPSTFQRQFTKQVTLQKDHSDVETAEKSPDALKNPEYEHLINEIEAKNKDEPWLAFVNSSEQKYSCFSQVLNYR